MINEVLSFALQERYNESTVGHLLCPKCVKEKVTLEATKIGRDWSHFFAPLTKMQQILLKKNIILHISIYHFIYVDKKSEEIILKSLLDCFKNALNVATAKITKDITFKWMILYTLYRKKYWAT